MKNVSRILKKVFLFLIGIGFAVSCTQPLLVTESKNKDRQSAEIDTLDASEIPLAAPASLRAAVTAWNQVDLSWDPVAGADGYYVSRTPDSGYHKTSTGLNLVRIQQDIGTSLNYQVQAYQGSPYNPAAVSPVSSLTVTVNTAVPGYTASQDYQLQNTILAETASLTGAERFYRIRALLETAAGTSYLMPQPVSEVKRGYYSVTLKSLKCYTTEDYTGADECSLEVVADGSKKAALRKDLNDGNVFTINLKYTFMKSFYLKLYDLDNPGFPLYDDNDWLGTINLKLSTGDFSAAFNRDGALYILQYAVSYSRIPGLTDVTGLSADQQKALVFNSYLNAFIPATVLSSVTRAEVWADVNMVIRSPSRWINQETTPTCGTSAVIFELARKFPAEFVFKNWEIAATGKMKGFDGTTYLFTPVTRNTLSVSNWLLTGIVNPSFDGSTIYPVTGDLKLMNIIKALLPFQTVGTDTTFAYGEQDAIEKGSSIIKKGGIAILCINDTLIRKDFSAFSSLIAAGSNHYIVLLGGLNISNGNAFLWDSGHYSFNYWTWGQDGWMMNANEGRFEDGFYGLVYAY